MCVPHTQTNWAALEAIGTIAAAIVALGLGLYGERISRRMRRPKKLKLETGSELWHYEDIDSPSYGEPPAGSWIWEFETVKIKVLNSEASRWPATEIRLRALKFFIGDSKTPMFVDPVTLQWSGGKGAEVLSYLSPSDWEKLDLFSIEYVNYVEPWFLRIPGSKMKLEVGDFRIELAIYSSSAPPDMRTLEVTFGHHPEGFPNYYISVREA